MGQSAAEGHDQSMEEILQSIKRIIADEEDAEFDPSAAKRQGGSDVLELTDIVQDDGTVVGAARLAPKVPANDSAKPKEMKPVIFEETPMPEAKKRAAPLDLDSLLAPETASASAESLKVLMNQQKAAVKPISVASPSFRSGVTVEDLVTEALKPMLKDWLDSHLPRLVEQLVEREVRRISGQ